jgi:hypothetical protein
MAKSRLFLQIVIEYLFDLAQIRFTIIDDSEEELGDKDRIEE